MPLTPQQLVEVEFWRALYADITKDAGWLAYMAFRANDLHATAGPMLPYLEHERGAGLDLGCGLVSKLGFLPYCECLVAVDPLVAEYDQIFYYRWPHVTTLVGSGEYLNRRDFPDAQYDFVWCCNVIDHTPDSTRMVAEIWRVLKPGGRLYLHVNYDPTLTEAHHELWNDALVAERLAQFKPLRQWKEWWAQHEKFVYRGIYQK